ncbi:uncharacterized protein [Anoplolepis gracilipes]|uniref:uncharacterized protein isoform X1 n=1 Tax=Anoplolepis gracilipes TaxID=354296 RepID=UPI003B9FAFC7
MLKSSLRILVASRQALRLSAFRADVSMSNTQEEITLPMRHDKKKRAVKYYEKCFDCRGVPQRGFCNIVGIDYTFPAKIEVGVRFALNSDYRATVQIKAPKNPPASRLISSRRFQTLRGSRSNYADSPRPFDTRATRSDSRARISLSAPKQNENQTATYST